VSSERCREFEKCGVTKSHPAHQLREAHFEVLGKDVDRVEARFLLALLKRVQESDRPGRNVGTGKCTSSASPPDHRRSLVLIKYIIAFETSWLNPV